MNQEELRKEASEKKYPMLKKMPNSAKITVANQRAAFKEGAEWEEKREKSVIEQLIAKYEDKVKSAEHLKQPKGTWGETITKSDIERLDVRIYERLTFIDDLKLLLTTPTKNK